MRHPIILGLALLPSGERYEDRYGKYIEIFHDVLLKCQAGEHVIVTDAPASWVPLLCYIGAEVTTWRTHFETDRLVYEMLRSSNDLYNEGLPKFTRTEVEVLCGFRPECVDALWKVDAQWQNEIKSEGRDEFIVTCNGSFWRPEVTGYLEALADYVPSKTKVVLVPCAADKPYPARMHKAVLDLLPSDFYLMNATGVLGLVPQDLWKRMPHYDSGIPNEWRVQSVVGEYFRRFPHEVVIVYCDFYNIAIQLGLDRARQGAVFVNEVKFYSDYLDLLAPARLEALRTALKENA